jgi:hypothetical protein
MPAVAAGFEPIGLLLGLPMLAETSHDRAYFHAGIAHREGWAKRPVLC